MAKSQRLAAVVKPVILSAVFINAPAPRKPIPVTIDPRSGNGLSGWNVIAVIAKAQEPAATNVNVPNPTGLCDHSRSRPKRKAKAKVIPSRKAMRSGSMDCLWGGRNL